MTTSNDKRVEIGLGGATSLGLAAARTIAGELREAVAVGRDPRTALPTDAAAEEKALTFGQFADAYIASIESGWRNAVHR